MSLRRTRQDVLLGELTLPDDTGHFLGTGSPDTKSIKALSYDTHSMRNTRAERGRKEGRSECDRFGGTS